MHALGIYTCGDLQKQTLLQLKNAFGSWAQDLKNYAHGIDNRAVETNSERKSLTLEETYNKDLLTLQECIARVDGLYEDWEKRMNRSNYKEKIRGIVIKLKFHDFKTTTHERAGKGWPTAADFKSLLEIAWNRRAEPIRLIGIGVRLASAKREEATDQLSMEV
jgi:DNA polymerase-4